MTLIQVLCFVAYFDFNALFWALDEQKDKTILLNKILYMLWWFYERLVLQILVVVNYTNIGKRSYSLQ
jgi:hypothetical protein